MLEEANTFVSFTDMRHQMALAEVNVRKAVVGYNTVLKSPEELSIIRESGRFLATVFAYLDRFQHWYLRSTIWRRHVIDELNAQLASKRHVDITLEHVMCVKPHQLLIKGYHGT